MSFWIDTHAHMVEECFQEEFDLYMKRAEEANVKRILCVCLNVEELKKGFLLKETYPCIDLAVGYYPCDTPKLNEQDWKELEEAVQDERVLAIGEIGLDYYWDKSYVPLQQECFIRQIQLANQVNKPILVHSRDAAQDTYDILAAHTPVRGGILHCYSSSAEMAKRFEKLGMYFALGGPLTYKNSKEGKDVVREMPLSRLFVETDCPYLPPSAYRGKQNETSYVHYAGECMAALKGVDVETVQKQQAENYKTLFNLKEL